MRQIEDSRAWPETVEAYEAMMEPNATRPVCFTYDSDREIVRFVFYRICFGLLHSFLPDEWSKAGSAAVLPSGSVMVVGTHAFCGRSSEPRTFG